jgi:hypothetical protein
LFYSGGLLAPTLYNLLSGPILLLERLKACC